MTDQQEATDTATVTVGNFNVHLLVTDRQHRPTSVGK